MNEQVMDPVPTSVAASAGAGGSPGRLKGKIGTVELMLTVLAFSAPLTVVAAFAVFVLSYNRSAPIAFVFAIVLLLLFAVGYTTMTRYLPNPGAFYAYITAGLGRFAGLGSSLLAMFGYVMMGVGTVCFFGVIASSLVSETFHGPHVTWWVYSVLCVLVAGSLGYFRIDLSAKVLSFVMGCEILIVLVFDASVLIKNGPEGRSFEPFSLGGFMSDDVGLAVLFAATCFLGFEATAIFREETRDPDKTIPRATYGAVLFIGVFYLASIWILILAYGPSKAQGVAIANYDGMFSGAVGDYVGAWATDVIRVLLCSSIFACLLSVQNILARYTFSLGIDRVLPGVLGRVHPKHGSPYVASLTVTTVVVVVLACVAIADADPGAVYSSFAGTGGFAVLVLMFLTGISALVFFTRRKDIERRVFHMFIAPALSAITLGVVLYLAVTNFAAMTGGSSTQAWVLQTALWATFVIGLVLAAVYRVHRPDTYQRIGRQRVGSGLDTASETDRQPDTLEELLRTAYEGELVGTALYDDLAGRLSGRERECALALGELERATADALEPLVVEYSVTVDPVASAAEGRRIAATVAGRPWPEAWTEISTLADVYLVQFTALADALATTHPDVGRRVVAHEEALIEFVRREVDGRANALQPVLDHLARYRSGSANTAVAPRGRS